MKKWMAPVVLAAAFGLAAGSAAAQTAVAPQSAQQRAPNVESIDILQQNQAERTRDQPGNLAPTYRIVKEGRPNYSSLPAREASVLIQPKAQFPGQSRATTAGEAWREYRNGPLVNIGGWLLIVALLAAAAMYFIRGPIRLKHAPTGRLIERFTSPERMVHWTTAISFVLLASSGLIMLFGKYVLLPWFGHPLFGWLAYLCKSVHNFVGPVFTLSIIVFFVMFVKDNLPAASDLQWFAKLGGLFSGAHVSAGRFNTGEKMWFWGGMVALGLIVSGAGFVLDMLVPGVDYTRANLQIANVIHIAGAVLIASLAVGHIYIGTIGMEGAYQAMRNGYVDDEWAAEHHDLWYADVQAGKVPRVRTQEGAEKLGTPLQV